MNKEEKFVSLLEGENYGTDITALIDENRLGEIKLPKGYVLLTAQRKIMDNNNHEDLNLDDVIRIIKEKKAASFTGASQEMTRVIPAEIINLEKDLKELNKENKGNFRFVQLDSNNFLIVTTMSLEKIIFPQNTKLENGHLHLENNDTLSIEVHYSNLNKVHEQTKSVDETLKDLVEVISKLNNNVQIQLTNKEGVYDLKVQGEIKVLPTGMNIKGTELIGNYKIGILSNVKINVTENVPFKLTSDQKEKLENFEQELKGGSLTSTFMITHFNGRYYFLASESLDNVKLPNGFVYEEGRIKCTNLEFPIREFFVQKVDFILGGAQVTNNQTTSKAQTDSDSKEQETKAERTKSEGTTATEPTEENKTTTSKTESTKKPKKEKNVLKAIRNKKKIKFGTRVATWYSKVAEKTYDDLIEKENKKANFYEIRRKKRAARVKRLLTKKAKGLEFSNKAFDKAVENISTGKEKVMLRDGFGLWLASRNLKKEVKKKNKYVENQRSWEDKKAELIAKRKKNNKKSNSQTTKMR